MWLCFSPCVQPSSAATRVWTGDTGGNCPSEETSPGSDCQFGALTNRIYQSQLLIYLLWVQSMILICTLSFDQRLNIHICNDPMEVGASQSSCRGVVSSVPSDRTIVAKMFSQGERTLIPKGDSFMSPNCVKKSDASWGGKLTVILISHSLKMRWWRRGHQPCDFNGNLMWMKVTDVECRKVPERRGERVLKRRWGR